MADVLVSAAGGGAAVRRRLGRPPARPHGAVGLPAVGLPAVGLFVVGLFVVGLFVVALVAGWSLVPAPAGSPVPERAYLASRLPGSPRWPPASAFVARVERVVDGDTLVAVRRRQRVRVRLIGVDAPESVRPGYPVECWGPESSVLLRRLLPAGRRLRVAYQPGGRRDRYGRELWDVWLPDGRFVQGVLARRGAAEAVRYPPQVAYAAYLARAQQRARARRVGLWGHCRDPT